MSDERLRRQHRYTVTPEHLILDPRLSDRAFRLWCRLDRYVGDHESAFPSRESLGIELDCSKSSIDRAVDELVAAGWLTKERRALGDTNLYTLVTVPEKAVRALIGKAREQRRESAAPRLERERRRRRDQKRRARGSDEVTAVGVVTHEETPESGVSSPMTTPLSSPMTRPLSSPVRRGVSSPMTTRRKQHMKEATKEGVPTHFVRRYPTPIGR